MPEYKPSRQPTSSEIAAANAAAEESAAREHKIVNRLGMEAAVSPLFLAASTKTGAAAPASPQRRPSSTGPA